MLARCEPALTGNPVQAGTEAGPGLAGAGELQSFSSLGTLPPFSASLRITALCRAMFCSALP